MDLLKSSKILIIDGDENISITLKKFLVREAFEVSVVQTGSEAINWIQKNAVDLIISDFKLTKYTGIEVLQKVKIINPKVQVIIATAYSDIRLAVEALKKGAFDYVTKPLYADEILQTINEALSSRNEEEQVPTEKVKKRVVAKSKEYILGPSYQSQLVQKHVDLIAPTNMSVIISGDTGTGKEYIAKNIHSKSNRASMPFVAIDCGALPQELAGSELFGHVKGAFTGALKSKIGCFERANGGTLFLDEIGNLTYEHQIQLLRVLQEQVVRKIGDATEIPVDVRVIVATNEDLKEAVKKGEFREDIFHRLNEFRIELAPLHDRPDDIEIFANFFLKQANRQLNKNISGFAKSTRKRFKTYSWPGNLRELRNVIKRAVLLCRTNEIDKSCLPVEISQINNSTDVSIGSYILNSDMPISLKEVADRAEKGAIVEVLRQTDYNKTKAAELLQVDRKTLYNKMKTLNIDTGDNSHDGLGK